VADPNAFRSRDVVNSSMDDGCASGGSSELDSLVSAISTSHMVPHDSSTTLRPVPRRPRPRKVGPPTEGKFEVEDSVFPVRSLKLDEAGVEPPMVSAQRRQQQARAHRVISQPLQSHIQKCDHLRILIVEVRPISFISIVCGPDGQYRTIQSMQRCSKSVSSMTAMR